MKAVVCYGEGVVKYEEVSMPSIKDDEVLVNVKVCGICRSDIPRALARGAHSYPTILGHEFSGVVVQVGNKTNSIKVGDRVVVAPLVPCHDCDECKKGNYSQCGKYSFVGSRQQGGMAEYVAIPAKNVVKINDTVSYEKGAFFEPSTVALHGIRLSNMDKDGTVAVLGGGTIGIFTMQWAKILGAKKVVVFGRSKKHLEAAIRMGADSVISTLDEDYKEQISLQTDGRGFDYVYETAGSIDTIKLAFEIAANKGRVCYIGTPTREFGFTVKEWEMLNRKELTIVGSWMSYSLPFPGEEWISTAEEFDNGRLKVFEDMIAEKYSMAEASEAFKLFEGGKTVNGRVLLING